MRVRLLTFEDARRVYGDKVRWFLGHEGEDLEWVGGGQSYYVLTGVMAGEVVELKELPDEFNNNGGRAPVILSGPARPLKVENWMIDEVID